ncbi:hypothetical protein K2Z83_09965 [Oscillochloris sp. ZM17-4]|uniref:hypothetical protein n=1 Tax=Oscillochloris sp. ZM17-4 TaxID=2866714 RepID=UPI001C7375E1|nr:hypothetical protein [Oscillochloris sp. ZM17-4]MBX0328000.1 hypothetical protein [Oscillochloris sp. ZM17-4]
MHSARNPFTPDVFGLPSDPLMALDLILAAGLTAGGVGHTLLTPVIYRRESALNQGWFAGSGLALAFLGMLNIIRVRGDDATARAMSRAANPAGTLFLGVVAARGAGPLSFAALALSAALTALSMRGQPAR